LQKKQTIVNWLTGVTIQSLVATIFLRVTPNPLSGNPGLYSMDTRLTDRGYDNPKSFLSPATECLLNRERSMKFY